MSSTSRRICVMRWRCPRRIGVPGMVTSTRSSVSRRSSSARVERRLALVDRRLEPLAERVQRHARLAVANLAERELQLALAAEELDAHLLDLVGRRSRRQLAASGRLLECLGVHGSAEVTNASLRQLQVVTCAEDNAPTHYYGACCNL